MENAERLIRDAIRSSKKLTGMNIEVFAQGSYKNNTNVKQDSDVDICVCLMDVCYTDYVFAQGLTDADVGLKPAPYSSRQFRDDVGEALTQRFAATGLKRGDKAFDIHANTYRVDADVVACIEHRRYSRGLFAPQYISGTQFFSDSGKEIVNWPKQHYENGVQKNIATRNRFKYITRAIKRLRNEMADNGVPAAKSVPSYLTECLVWNAPDAGLGAESYVPAFRQSLAHLIVGTLTNESCKEWGEVNELKYLFRGGQPWTRQQAHEFVIAAWNYIGFK
ncbi:MAG: nucleotidyltransferase [Terriglobales bacterium]|jgi:hypothetical protein